MTLVRRTVKRASALGASAVRTFALGALATGAFAFSALSLAGCPPPPSQRAPGAFMPVAPADAALIIQAKSPSVLLTGPIGRWLEEKRGAFVSGPVGAVFQNLPAAALTAGLGIDNDAPITLSVRPTGDVLVEVSVTSSAAFAAGLEAFAQKTGTSVSRTRIPASADTLITVQKPGETWLVVREAGTHVTLWVRPADAFAARATLLADRSGPVFQRVPALAPTHDVFVRYRPHRGPMVPMVADLESALGAVDEVTLAGGVVASAPGGRKGAEHPVFLLTLKGKTPLDAVVGVPRLCAARVDKDAVLWFSVPAQLVSGSRFVGQVGVAAALTPEGRLRYVVEATPKNAGAGRSLLDSVRDGAQESATGRVRVSEDGREIEIFEDDQPLLKARSEAKSFTLSHAGGDKLVGEAQCLNDAEVPFFVDVPRLFAWAAGPDIEPGVALRLFRAFAPVLRGIGSFQGAYRVSNGTLQLRFSSPDVTGRALWLGAEAGPGPP